MTRPKPSTLGPPLDLTAEQLEQAAEVTTVDAAAARALWNRAAPPRLTSLLDAAPKEEPRWTSGF